MNRETKEPKLEGTILNGMKSEGRKIDQRRETIARICCQILAYTRCELSDSDDLDSLKGFLETSLQLLRSSGAVPDQNLEENLFRIICDCDDREEKETKSFEFSKLTENSDLIVTLNFSTQSKPKNPDGSDFLEERKVLELQKKLAAHNYWFENTSPHFHSLVKEDSNLEIIESLKKRCLHRLEMEKYDRSFVDEVILPNGIEFLLKESRIRNSNQGSISVGWMQSSIYSKSHPPAHLARFSDEERNTYGDLLQFSQSTNILAALTPDFHLSFYYVCLVDLNSYVKEYEANFNVKYMESPNAFCLKSMKSCALINLDAIKVSAFRMHNDEVYVADMEGCFFKIKLTNPSVLLMAEVVLKCDLGCSDFTVTTIRVHHTTVVAIGYSKNSRSLNIMLFSLNLEPKTHKIVEGDWPQDVAFIYCHGLPLILVDFKSCIRIFKVFDGSIDEIVLESRLTVEDKTPPYMARQRRLRQEITLREESLLKEFYIQPMIPLEPLLKKPELEED